MIATTPTQLILESLRSAPPLIGDLPEAAVLDQGRFGPLHASTLEEPLRFDQKLGHLYEQALSRLLEIWSWRLNFISQSKGAMAGSFPVPIRATIGNASWSVCAGISYN